MRLYRFKDVIGNKSSINMLQKSLERNALPNFIIMAGSPGTGKSTCAEIAGLRLTCINPQGSEPCLQCESCLTNLRALQSTGISNNLVKKNLGRENTKKDIEAIINEIFILKGSVGNSVYILEEAHILGKNEQTALLEEIDRLDQNTYMIMCTTKPFNLLPELRSRAITFNFNSLNSEELNILFDRTCAKLSIEIPRQDVKQIIMNYSKFVPRNLVNLLSFIQKNGASEDDIKSFLGDIPAELFINLFGALKLGLSYSAPLIDDILRTTNINEFTYNMKEFFIDIMFLLEGDIKGKFSREEIATIKVLFPKRILSKLLPLFEKIDTRQITETDLKYLLIKCSKIMNDTSVASVLTNNNKSASKQQYLAEQNAKEVEEIKQEEKSVLTQLTSFDLD
ncbi:AAA family ATPase [uncultured Clostridium sp.]|uniref:AAA family ATPase n=1 Tax=uncultured Clostridium sp. TaxID=59620 RepID=UPI0026F40973|nr:AAA family ATPase [uncultured Clostridium sp.]